MIRLLAQLVCPSVTLIAPVAMEPLYAPRISHLNKPVLLTLVVFNDQNAHDGEGMVVGQSISI